MSESSDRVVERLTACEQAKDVTIMRGDDALFDALTLLREAAPAPDEPIDLGLVRLVCWTFWFRYHATEGAAQQQAQGFVLGTFGFLHPRLAERGLLPEPLRAAAETAFEDSATHDAHFGYLVGSAYGQYVLTNPGLAAVDRALAWTEAALSTIRADDPMYGLVALQSMGQHAARFELAADPDSFGAAARSAMAAYRRLPPADPDVADGIRGAVEVITTAAVLLGDPPFDQVRQLHDGLSEQLLTENAVTAMGVLQELHDQPVDWPGSPDLRFGGAVLALHEQGGHAGVLACGIRWLRSALAKTPADHPEHDVVAVVLANALIEFGGLRDDLAARREGVEILARVDPDSMPDSAKADISDALELITMAERGEEISFDKIGPLLERALRRDDKAPDDLGLEPKQRLDFALFVAYSAHERQRLSDEQVERYRAELSSFPADAPNRFGYTATLAALLGLRARAVADTDPARAAELAAEVDGLVEEVAAIAPAGFAPLTSLRKGRYDEALTMAAVAGMAAGEPVERTVEVLLDLMGKLENRTDDAGAVDLSRLDEDVAPIRELLAGAAADGSIPPEITEVLTDFVTVSGAISDMNSNDPARVDEAVAALRGVRSRQGPGSPDVDSLLALALDAAQRYNADPAAVLEAAVVFPDTDELAELAESDVDEKFVVNIAALRIASNSLLHRNDVSQFEHARQLIARLRELSGLISPKLAQRYPRIDEQLGATLEWLRVVEPGHRQQGRIDEGHVGEIRQKLAALGPDHLGRLPVLLELIQALTVQSMVVRPTDPERAAELVTEAHELARAAELSQSGSGREAFGWLRALVGSTAEGELASGFVVPESPSVPADQPSGSLLDALRTLLPLLITDAPDAESLESSARDPRLPVWMRAVIGIMRALKAMLLTPPRVGLALSYAEEALQLMPRVIDRGRDRASAEYSFEPLDGLSRSIGNQVLSHVLSDATFRQFSTNWGSGSAKNAELDASIERLRGLAGRDDLGDADRVRAQRLLAVVSAARDQVPRLIDATGRTTVSTDGPLAELRHIGGLDVGVGPAIDRVSTLLEGGRGVLLAQQLETRTDLDELRSTHPELAGEFTRLSDQLAADPDELAVLRPQDDPPATGRSGWSKVAKSRASRELEAVIERVRGEDGFADFLLPLSAEQLRRLACDGPVVVLIHSLGNCHALVVTADAIFGLRLGLLHADVLDVAGRLRAAIDTINSRGRQRPSPERLLAAGAALRETLSWTWHKIVRPVLSVAAIPQPKPDGVRWPRIWWVPTGAFNALPLHAAECTLPDCEIGDCGAALDAVVSSYVPGFRALAHARTQPATRGRLDGSRALLVAEDELPGVVTASQVAAGLLGAPDPLVGAAATHAAVLAALADATWVHFGCHATSDPAEPSGGVLHLPSGERLSVAEICRARPGLARLAFLAACATARTSERLPDEAVHITSAFLVAGFPEAIGTLWEIDSGTAGQVIDEFYRRGIGERPFASPAEALHDTVRQLRARHPDRPHHWAAYVHAGA